MFDPTPPQVSFPDQERELLEFWRKEEVFRRSVEDFADRPTFTFYEGPPTANGKPHWGHVLTRVCKDVFLRYKSMTGYCVPRRAGWDTHGLPVEIEVEKELGIHGKEDIEKYGIEAFTRKCIDSVFTYVNEWERMSDRVAFWVDNENAYATYHRAYVESVWWALHELFKQGLLYQGHKIVWWWPQGGTALSANEVGEGYKTVDDPSVVVRFKLSDRENTSFLAWTTTPWTLPSNVALAVAANETYVEAKMENGETLILAEGLREKILGDAEHEVVKECPGSELVGLKYEPLFRYREVTDGKAWEVTSADFVTLDAGTGIVHVAPAFGEDDFKAAQEKGFGMLRLIEPNGCFSDDATDFAGRFCKDADKDIIKHLDAAGLLFSRASYRHEYPFCPRAQDDPLIQYARHSWFIRTSGEKDRVVANNDAITWQPAHIKEGRMGDFLRNNVDWAISRERWWGTPLPIWINDETGEMDCVSSVADILERNPDAFVPFEEAKKADPTIQDDLMVHKPWIDGVTWTKEGEPGTYRRVTEVIDCWFDAGSMPFAQWGYPHQNKDELAKAFPADFITEAIDQTRGWWNALQQISTLLFPEAEAPRPFKSCVVLGHVVDRKGKKLSKSLKNYDPPDAVLEEYGADSVRWALFTAGVPGLNIRFDASSAKEATRDLMLKVWNVFSFLVTYARIDGWTPEKSPALSERHSLDRWVLAELNQAIADVRGAFDRLESHTASRRIQSLVDAVSNWYLRRSRARFWGEGDTTDKRAAFATLYEVLSDLSKILAPFTPFLAETLYQRLSRAADDSLPVSVHLTDYPETCADREDDALRESMGLVRSVAGLGRQVRTTHDLKVRQPLSEVVVILAGEDTISGSEESVAAIREELNVHEVRTTDEPAKYVEFDVAPNFKALGKRLGKRMKACQAAMRAADSSDMHASLEADGKVTVTPDDGGDAIELTGDDVQIRIQAREGYAAASEGSLVVVLDTRLTDDLRREGLAREVVNRIQTARKTMDLPYEARIEVTYEANEALEAAIDAHREHVAGETLSTSFAAGSPKGERHEVEVEGDAFVFGIKQV